MNSKTKIWGLVFLFFVSIGLIVGSGLVIKYNFDEVAEMDDAGNIQSLLIQDDYLFAFDQDFGLKIYNISENIELNIISTFAMKNDFHSMMLIKDHLYIANGVYGMVIVNITNITKPSIIGSFDDGGKAHDIFVEENYAFIADGNDGLEILNISDPTHPTEIGSFDDGGDAKAVVKMGNIIYVADAEEGLEVLHIFALDNITEIFQYDNVGDAEKLIVDGQFAYLADGSNGLVVLNISSPYFPSKIASYDRNGYIYGIEKIGNKLHVAAGKMGYIAFDMSNPVNPMKTQRYDDGGLVYGMVVYDNHLIIAAGIEGIEIISLKSDKDGTWNTVGLILLFFGIILIPLVFGLMYGVVAKNIEDFQETTLFQIWDGVNTFFTRNLFITLTKHEFSLAAKARVQKIWFYLGVLYALLMVLTIPSLDDIQSMLVFFINFGTIFAFIPASSAISGEIGGIADTILSKSVKRWQYILSKHLAYILVVLITYIIMIGGTMAILAGFKVFDSSIKPGYLIMIIGLDALILCMFTSLGILLSSLFTKPIFPILGCFVAWFILIFLFILVNVWTWQFSPVVINSHFLEIISDDWAVKYWQFFVAYGSATIACIGVSIIAFYRLDF